MRIGWPAWVFVVIGTLFLPFAATTFWVQQTVTNTDTFVATVGGLADEEIVREAVATQVTAALDEAVDTEELLNEWFPDAPDGLKQTMAGAIESLVDQVVTKMINSPEFAELWRTSVKFTQEQLVALLNGDDDRVLETQGDKLVLNLTPVVDRAREGLEERGIALKDRDRDVVIELADVPQVTQAQQIYGIAQPVAQWVILIPIILFAVAVLISRNKPKGLQAVGAAGIAGGVLLLVGWIVGQAAVSGLTANPALAETMYRTVTDRLWWWVGIFGVVGLLVLIGGLYWQRASLPDEESESA